MIALDVFIGYLVGCLITTLLVIIIQILVMYEDYKKDKDLKWILYQLRLNVSITIILAITSWAGFIFILATLLGLLIDYIRDKIKNS